MLRSAAFGAAIALVSAGGASAEVVARGVQDGLLALNGRAVLFVAFVRGPTLYVSTRSATGRWTVSAAASVASGSTVTAFKVDTAGPVVLVESADVRTLLLVRRFRSAAGRRSGSLVSPRLAFASGGQGSRSTARACRSSRTRAGTAPT